MSTAPTQVTGATVYLDHLLAYWWQREMGNPDGPEVTSGAITYSDVYVLQLIEWALNCALADVRHRIEVARIGVDLAEGCTREDLEDEGQ